MTAPSTASPRDLSLLEECFPRVAEKIASLWPDRLLAGGFFELVFDTRGNRRGFPAGAMGELLFLHGLCLERARPGAAPRSARR
ncbi:MAG: hypothetical protein M0037_11095 [Betaproteobacteria bacterium]|nr:hypothetical protein [Betaproteobacteria bacterium]